MKKFAIEVHGRGFPVPTDDGTLMDGFLVTGFVEPEGWELTLRSIPLAP